MTKMYQVIRFILCSLVIAVIVGESFQRETKNVKKSDGIECEYKDGKKCQNNTQQYPSAKRPTKQYQRIRTTPQNPRERTTRQNPRARTTGENPRARTTPQNPRARTTPQNPRATTTRQNSRSRTTRQNPRARTTPESPRARSTPQNPRERRTTQRKKPSSNQLPPGYPKDYYRRVKRPFPRRNFTCSRACYRTCQMRPRCLAKDFLYMYSLDFMKAAPEKVILSGILLNASGALDRLDDHISCGDMLKILNLMASYSLLKKLKVIAMTDLGDRMNLRKKIGSLLEGKDVSQSDENNKILDSVEQMKEIDDIKALGSFLPLLKDQPLSGVMTNLSTGSMDILCKHLKLLGCRVQTQFLKNVDLSYCIQKFPDVKPSVSLVWNYLYERYGDPRKWNDEVWMKNVQAYMPIMVDDRTFVSLFPDMLMFNMLKNVSGCKDIDINDKLKQMIRDKLKRILKESKDTQVTGEAVKLLLSCGGHVEDMKKYATDEQVLNSFDSQKKVSGRDKAAMRKILKKKKADASKWTKEEIVKYASLIMNDRKTLKQLDKTALEGAICDIGSQIEDVNQARKLKLVLRTLDSYKDFTTYTKEKIVCLKQLLGTLSSRDVGKMPTDALGQAIVDGDLNDVNFPCSVASAVLKKYKEHVGKSDGALTSVELTQLPDRIKACFRPADVSKIPSDQLNMDVVMNFIKIFENRDPRSAGAIIRKIIQKVKDNSDIITALAKSKLGQYIPPSLLKQSVDIGQEIANQLQAGEPVTFKADCRKAKYMYGKLVEVIGPPSDDNFNWTTEAIRSLKESNILSGMTLAHLKEIPDALMFQVADSFLASKCITGIKKKLIMKKYSEVQEVNSTTVTTEDIQKIDPEILLNQDNEKLEKYGENHRSDICKAMGQINTTEVSMGKILRKARFCPECVNPKVVSTTNVTNCGALMCALPLKYFDRLEKDVLSTYAEKLAVDCQWDHSKRRKLVELAQEKGVINRPDNMTDMDLTTLKTLVADLTTEEIEEIPGESLSLADSEIASAFKERDEREKTREEIGFKSDFTEEEREKRLNGTLSVFKRIIENKLAAGANVTRRKRATYTLTCDDLKSLGTVGLPAVSAEALNAVDNAEFQDCLTTLGLVTGWSTEQKETLASKMKSIYGSPNTWTSGTISTAGTMIQGLDATDITTLQVDLDSISVLGQIDGWTASQTRSAYEAFMSKVKSGSSASSLTSTELTSLGNFVCGMLATEIETITPSVYLDSADEVGRVSNCNAEQLQAMATVAKHVDAFGNDIAAWDEVTISSIGVVLGGLPKEDISKLSAGQIDSIDPGSISFLPDIKLSYFTATQLGYFSSAQAQATTVDQRAHLSYKQFMTLQAAAETKWEDAPISGAGRLYPGYSIAVSCTMTILLWIILEYT